MANRPGQRQAPLSAWWLVGAGLLLFGILTLVIVLGWVRSLEAFAIAVGLAIFGVLFLIYFWADRSQGWATWAAYIVFSAAVLLTVTRLFRLSRSVQVAATLVSVGLPFLYLYLRRVWFERNHSYWWTLIPAGGLLTVGLALIQLRVGWPDRAIPGVLVFTFMGGMTLTLFILWFPARDDERLDWVPIPLILTTLVTILGCLMTISLVELALPFLLVGLGLIVVTALVLQQWFKPKTIHVSSSAFESGETIPVKHTCAADPGQEMSPPIQWTSLPAGTQSLALICDSPDAKGWTHWLLYNMPATLKELPEGIAPGEIVVLEGLPAEIRQGLNDFGSLGYRGPCPPRQTTMRYFFHIYALDTKLTLPPGLTKSQLRRSIQPHILAEGELVGMYKREEPEEG